MSRFFMFSNVLFEDDGLSKLAEEIARLKISRPLLVTDPGLANLGLVDRCTSLCPGFAVYAETPENPTEAAAQTAAELYQAEGCDGIVAIGGGSSMDLGKAVGLIVSHDGDLAEFDVTGPNPRPLDDIPPLLVIPTTAGTGTEVSVGCVITLNNGHKATIDSEKFIPAAVICDPLLTVSLPPRLTAATGIDALSHCIEGYCSNLQNPLTEPVALDGVRRIAGAIERAVQEPNNIQARRDMMIGSLQGGVAMSMELGAAHALSVPLGAEFHEHHGELTGAVLGAAMKFNEPAQKEQLQAVRHAIGIPDGDDLQEWMNNFCEKLGLRTRLSDFGVTENSLEGIAEEAANSFFNDLNYRKGTTEDYLAMLRSQY